MSEKSIDKIILPKSNTMNRDPPPTPLSHNSETSFDDLRFHTSPTSFFYYSSAHSMGEERKDLEQIHEVDSSENKRSVVLLHGNKMIPKPVLEKNKTKFSHSDHIVSLLQSPLLSPPFLTPATSLETFNGDVVAESGKSRSTSSDSKKKNGNRKKYGSVGLKPIIKDSTSIMDLRDEKSVFFPSPLNQSPTISLIALRLDKICPKSTVKRKLKDIPSLKVRGLSDIKKNEKHRKGKLPAKQSGEAEIKISEGKSDEKMSLQSLHSSPISRRKKSSISSPTLRSVSPRSDTSTNTTPHKYLRLPPHLETLCKHATSLFRDRSADSINSKELNSCWSHLEAIYKDAGARIRLDSNERPRCMSCPGRKQEILTCPAFVHFSTNKRDPKVVRDSRSRRKYSSEDEASPSPCSPTKRSMDRSASAGFTRHTKDWTNAVHDDASDRSVSDSNKEESSKCNSGREEGSIEMKSHNLNRERIVRFSIGTLTGNEEPVRPIRSPKEKSSKFSSFFWNRRPGSGSKSHKHSQKLDSSEIPESEGSKIRASQHSESKKQRLSILHKIKISKTSVDSSTRLNKEEKSNSARKKDSHRERENRPKECFSAEVSSGRKIQFNPTTELIVEQDKKDIAIGTSSPSLHKNRKHSKHSQKLFSERKNVHDFEIPPDKITSSEDVLNFSLKHGPPESSNSDVKSTTTSSSVNSVNGSSTIVSSSPDSESKFQNQSRKSSIMKTDTSSRGSRHNSGQPMFARTRKTNLSCLEKHSFKENKSVSLDAIKLVDRGSSPVGFHSEGLLLSCPSSAKSKSMCNSSMEVNKARGVSKSQQTVPCVNLQYPRFKTVVEAIDAESENGSNSPKSSLKPTILIPKKNLQKTSQIQRKTTGKNSLPSDGVKSENKNSSLEKTETSIQKNNLEKSQNKKSINDLSHQKTVSSNDLNNTLCAVRDKKMLEKSEENARKSNDSTRREKPSATITRDKRQSSVKTKPIMIRQSRKSTPQSFEKTQKRDVPCGTAQKEEMTVKSTTNIENPPSKEKSVKEDELNGKMNLNTVNERQSLQKVTLKEKEAIVDPKVKSRNTLTIQITNSLLNNDNSSSGGKGKQTAPKVSFSFQDSSAETKVKTGYIVGTQRQNSNSRNQDSVAELLKDGPKPCSAKGQHIPPTVPFSAKRSNPETKQKLGNVAGIHVEDVNFKKPTQVSGTQKDFKANLVSSNERQKASNISSPAKRNSFETKDNSFKNTNSLITVEVSKDKIILSGVNGRQMSKITSSSKGSNVESKLKSSSSSTIRVADNDLNKSNQASNSKINTIGRQISSKVSLCGNGNTVETKMKPETFSSTNLKDSSSKKRDATTATETLREEASLSIVSKRQSPSRVSFLLKSKSVEGKSKTTIPSPAKVDDNSLNKQNSFVPNESPKVKRSASGTNTRLTQSKCQGKVQGTDGKNKSKTVLPTKRGESFSKSTKKVSKPQNALNTNLQKLNTRNTSTKKNPPVVSKVMSCHKPNTTDVTSRPRSISEHSILARTSKTNGDSKSSGGPRLLGSETINGSALPNQPSTYTVNTCFLPAYEVWPGYLEHGQTKEPVPQYYCDTCRGVVCLPQKENMQYLNEVYYAVPVKFPFAGRTLRFKDENERHFESRGSFDSLEDGQTYYVKRSRDRRIYSPRREWVHRIDSDRTMYEYQNGRYLIPNSAVHSPLFEVSRGGTPVDEHVLSEDLHERSHAHAYPMSLPVASCPAFSVGTTAFTHMCDFTRDHL